MLNCASQLYRTHLQEFCEPLKSWQGGLLTRKRLKHLIEVFQKLLAGVGPAVTHKASDRPCQNPIAIEEVQELVFLVPLFKQLFNLRTSQYEGEMSNLREGRRERKDSLWSAAGNALAATAAATVKGSAVSWPHQD